VWIQQPGIINEQIEFLGAHKNCLYLLKGKEGILIGGGMSWVAPALEKQFAAMKFDPRKIRSLVITHSHFDHCGAVPYLKRKFPHLKILASPYAKEVFSKEKAVSFIATQNEKMAGLQGVQEETKRLRAQFDGIQVDQTVADGDILDLGGGIRAQILEVPGHTKCSIGVYVPELQALFPTDAFPFPTADGKEPSFPSAQYDFDAFKKSFQKMAALSVKMLAFDHHGVFGGDRVKDLFCQALEKVMELKESLLEEYRQIRDFELLAKSKAAESRMKSQLDFLDEELQLIVMKTNLRKILGDSIPAA